MRKRLLALILAAGCSTAAQQAEQWAEGRGYSAISIHYEREPAIGPHRCAPGAERLRLAGNRFPVPEENPCIQIKTEFILCCSQTEPRCTVLAQRDRCVLSIERRAP